MVEPTSEVVGKWLAPEGVVKSFFWLFPLFYEDRLRPVRPLAELDLGELRGSRPRRGFSPLYFLRLGLLVA